MSEKGGLVRITKFGRRVSVKHGYVDYYRGKYDQVIDLTRLSNALMHPDPKDLRAVLGFVMAQALKDFRSVDIVLTAPFESLNIYDWEGEIKIIAAQYNSSVTVSRKEETE